MTPRQCTLGRRETRHHRVPRQRKDHALQPPHRRGGRRRAAAGPGPAERRRRARARRPRDAARGALPARARRSTRASRSSTSPASIGASARRWTSASSARPMRSSTWCGRSRRPRSARRPPPAREVQALEEELVLADLEVVERRLQKLGPGLKRKPTDAEQREHALLARVQGPLEEGVPLRAPGADGGGGAAPPGVPVPVAEADPPLPEPRRGRRRRAREGAWPSWTRSASGRRRSSAGSRRRWRREVAALAARGAAELPRRAGAARAGAPPRDPRRLHAARAGQLLHGGRGRGPGLDDPGRRGGRRGRRARSTPTSRAASSGRR